MHVDVHALAALLIVTALALLDWVMGVLAAVRVGTYAWSQLPRQLVTTVLPIIGALAVLFVVQALAAGSLGGTLGLSAIAPGAFMAASATYAPKAVIDIVAKCGSLLSPPAPPVVPHG